MKKNVLILGANGMLGSTVYNHFSSIDSVTTFGTVRNGDLNANLLRLSVASVEKDFKIIQKKINRIDYVINCIGALGKSNSKELTQINSKFPCILIKLAEAYNFKLIHISSDAVFANDSQEVTELDSPSPSDFYGKSKLAGEPNSINSITFRTSILGFDPYKHKGLLEWAISAKKPIKGFTNQMWSGCTTLQLAKLFEKIITRNKFEELRELSPFFHFVTIDNVSKYQILDTFLTLLKQPKNVTKSEGTLINRHLKSIYSDRLWINEFKNELKDSLEELLKEYKLKK